MAKDVTKEGELIEEETKKLLEVVDKSVAEEVAKQEKETDETGKVTDKKDTNTDEKKEEDVKPDDPTEDDQARQKIIEEMAEKIGWRPKDKFEGRDGDKFVPAYEYIINMEAINKKQSSTNFRLEKSIESIKKNVNKMINHQKKVSQTEIENVTNKLKEERRNAIREGDVDTVEALDKKISAVLEGADYGGEETDERPPTREFMEWHEKNDWYGTDEELTDMANAISGKYEGSDKTIAEVLKIVDKKMERFIKTTKEPNPDPDSEKDTPSKQTVSKVSGGGRQSGGKKFTSADLTHEQRTVAKDFVETIPGYTMQKYVDELVKIGELK